MYNIVQQGDTVDYGVIECIADARTDIASLPTTWQPGSICLVLADSSIWALNSDGEWCEIKSSGGGSSDYVTKTELLQYLASYATTTQLATKQDKLTAGDNITISDDNIISATGGGKIDDVQVNGVSVVTDKIANITGYTVTLDV